jgi:hypothetical protein
MPSITRKDLEDMEARGLIREIVHGQWVPVEEEKMAGELHGAIATNLILALGSYVKAHALGRVYPADTTDILEELSTVEDCRATPPKKNAPGPFL